MEDFTNLDLSSLTAAPELGGGSGQTPGVYVPRTIDDATAAPAYMQAAASAAPAQNPFNASQPSTGDINTDYTQATFWRRTKQKLGVAQSAIVSPVQSFGQKAAKAVGASDGAASTISAALLPVLLTAAVVAVVVHFVRKHTRTVKA